MENIRYTPDYISVLGADEVFVFGSNAAVSMAVARHTTRIVISALFGVWEKDSAGRAMRFPRCLGR